MTSPPGAEASRDHALVSRNGDLRAPQRRCRLFVTDRIDDAGKGTLRYDAKLFKIGVGQAHKHLRVRRYVADRDVRIVTFDGELPRELTLGPTRIYQPLGKPQKQPSDGFRCPRCLATSQRGDGGIRTLT